MSKLDSEEMQLEAINDDAFLLDISKNPQRKFN